MIVALALARAVTRQTGARTRPAETEARRRRGGRLRDDLQAGFRYVRQSRLIYWTAISAVLFQALYFLLAFPFSKSVEVTFPVADEMTART